MVILVIHVLHWKQAMSCYKLCSIKLLIVLSICEKYV